MFKDLHFLINKRINCVGKEEANNAPQRSFFTECKPASLQLEQLTWSPHPNKSFLKNVTLKIKAGEFVAIVGANGSGKTSLLRCLYRVNKLTSGQVLLDGKNIWEMPARICAQRIATVLQESSAEFALTVFEMVEIGLIAKSTSWKRTQADHQAVKSALEELDILHFIGRDFNSLSGGERQRVMIARALVQRPDILILDEPTNHLDIRHQLEVLSLLSKLPCTIIITLHDLSLAAAYADRMLVMKKGEVEYYSSANEALTEQKIEDVFDVKTIIDQHPITARPRFSFYLKNQ